MSNQALRHTLGSVSDATSLDPLAGRVALVTGGAGFIGSAISRRLAAAGAAVAIGHHTSSDAAEAMVGAIVADGGRAMSVSLDVGDPAAAGAAVAAVQAELGPIDLLVNNAGGPDDGLLVQMSEQRWSQVIDTNLTGTYRLCRIVLRSMIRRRWGRIVNIGSVAGLSGTAGQASYAAAKAGLVGLSRALAREVGTRGITVNVVAPGLIDSPLVTALDESTRTAAALATPLARLGTAEEVAACVHHLCAEASYTTGAVVPVDGGLGMGH